MYIKYLLSFTAALTSVTAKEAKSVFAHFILWLTLSEVGNAASMTLEEWKSDIKLAKEAHIDGFALNIAPQDGNTDAILQKAYKAAGEAGDFALFLSFDYASGGPWPSNRVIEKINTYKSHSAQFKYKDRPLASTFEGANNADDWLSIKKSTDCFFMPSWTSLGPEGFKRFISTVDGAFSWDAWSVGAQAKTVDSDRQWMKAIDGRPYMMPISPWFYTNLPQWNKNWLWRGDDLWHDRWQQIIELQPALVQIITWNDYGESHHIGPVYKTGIPKGAEWYVDDDPHDGWRALLPDYIDRFKSGNLTTEYSSKRAAPVKKDIISYWYRRNPASAGSNGGTTGNNPAMGQPSLDPALVSQDKVFISILASEPSDVSVQIGDSAPSKLSAKVAGVNHFSVPFNNRLGRVSIIVSRSGSEVVRTTGPEITRKCKDGKVNWNAFAGSSLDKAENPSDYDLAHRSIEVEPCRRGPESSSISPEAYTKPYCDFMTANPTIFHAIAAFSRRLDDHGFTKLSERDVWTSTLKPGKKYYCPRNDSSLIAFAIGRDYKCGNGIGVVAGHVDALCAKLKPVSKLPTKAGYVQLGVAPYAGALSSTWWDRDLGVGGRVLVRNPDSGVIEPKLVKLDWPIARIPTLAVHFGAPSRGPFNAETQAVPVIGLDNSDIRGVEVNAEASGIEKGTFAATQPERLVKAIAKALGISDYSTIVNWELELFDTQPAQLGGLDKEFIFAGRIDDKLCCYSAFEALLASSEERSTGIVKMVGMFDDEEIGSLLRQGARSNYMSSVIARIVEAFAPNYGPNLLSQTIANSFLVSSDVTHAVNPNFMGQYLENHSPRLNIGVTICTDPNGHMTTDSVSNALLHRIAAKCDSVLQIFQIRNDSRSGGTIGPMTSARTGMRAIDCGIPQLSMHSIRATTGSLDPGLGVKFFKGFFDYFEEVDKEFQHF
ncbi:vacuolar aminopeptidase 1 [Emydomyces testavorans]|uniref:Vacuolar aminopeptidase 1 n=1 Tax=Emydomyces testavorans TaxID=2070801 RepID=A0AAF0DE60_9EURO|nr:vacuolar aminopeptidase 1 [Emydomyces testavorans]